MSHSREFSSDREMYWILTKHEMQQITGENSSDSDLILYCILTWFCEQMQQNRGGPDFGARLADRWRGADAPRAAF